MTLMLHLILVPFTHSIIYRRKVCSPSLPTRQRRLVKTRIGQDQPGSEVILHRPTSTPLRTSRTPQA